MIILTIRTDKPEAEIGLFNNDKRLAYDTWHAHRELAETIHRRIDDLLKSQSKMLQDVQGVAVFQGPGSFTGLRIGLTVANTLADSLSIPVAAAQSDDWIATATTRLQAGETDGVALPFYGADAHITAQKK